MKQFQKMRQLLCVMLVLTLASFTYPVKKTGDAPRTVKTKTNLFDSPVYFINYSGAASGMTVYIGSNAVAIDDNTGSLGYYPEGSYGLNIVKGTPDDTPRYVQIEDPNYEGTGPFYEFYWSSGDFSSSINVNTTWNNVSVGYLQ
jgi:hypothetical protein